MDDDPEMKIGTTVGPFYDRIASLDEFFTFAEVTVGCDGQRLADVPTEEIAGRLDDAGLDCTAHLPTTYPVAVPVPEVHEATLDYFERALRVASEIGASKAVVHAATQPHDEASAETLVESVRDLTARGETHGVEVCFENVGHIARGFDLATVGEALSEADGAMCFDIGHAYMEVGNDGIEQFLNDYADLVSHVHVHDARERDDTHILLGSGEVDPTTASALGGRELTAAVEVFTDDQPYLVGSARRFRDAVSPDRDRHEQRRRD
jgi:sugar phosphate isomerase/epimerase